MCSDCWNQALLNMAAMGSTSTTWPSTMRNPAGLFIQALAEMTKMAEAVPLMAIGNAVSQCATRREAIPAVEIEPEEDGLDEEGEPLRREGEPDDAAGVAHEDRPEESQLEGEDRAGDRTDGEEDGESFGPAADEGHVDRVTGSQPQPLGDEEEDGQTHAEHGEDDVEGEGGAHLGASGEKIGQSALPTRMLARETPSPGSRWTKDTSLALPVPLLMTQSVDGKMPWTGRIWDCRSSQSEGTAMRRTMHVLSVLGVVLLGRLAAEGSPVTNAQDATPMARQEFVGSWRLTVTEAQAPPFIAFGHLRSRWHGGGFAPAGRAAVAARTRHGGPHQRRARGMGGHRVGHVDRHLHAPGGRRGGQPIRHPGPFAPASRSAPTDRASAENSWRLLPTRPGTSWRPRQGRSWLHASSLRRRGPRTQLRWSGHQRPSLGAEPAGETSARKRVTNGDRRR